MLVLRRKNWQGVRIVHRSGDVMLIRVYQIRDDAYGRSCCLAFDDAPKNFIIDRPDRFRAALGSADGPTDRGA